MAIVTACTLGFALAGGTSLDWLGWFFAPMSLALLGWLDDWKGGISGGFRLLAQCLVAFVLIWFTSPLSHLPLPDPANLALTWVAWPLSALWLVAVVNLTNFMDGIDGLVASQGVIAGIAWSLYSGDGPGYLFAAGCAGFLLLNWHPARIFMGDVGSFFVGGMIAVLPFSVSGDSSASLLMTALFWWMPLSDASFTLLRRIVKGEKVWQAHRSHLYQRLVICGWSHAQVSLLYALLGISIATITLVCKHTDRQMWLPLGTACALFTLLVSLVEHRERRCSKG
ncbi:MAG: glycosyl transferase [Acidobacteria bacterium]|nr:glycosyl transferase [Acidobacteriota bacterium]